MKTEKKLKKGEAREAIWELIQKHFPHQHFSPADLKNVGLSESFYNQFRSRIAKEFIKENRLIKKERGRYKVLTFAPIKKPGQEPERMGSDVERLKIKLQAMMQRLSDKIESLEKDIENCIKSILKAEKEKEKLGNKKREAEEEMKKLKRVSDVLLIHPEIAEIVEDIKKLDI